MQVQRVLRFVRQSIDWSCGSYCGSYGRGCDRGGQLWHGGVVGRSRIVGGSHRTCFDVFDLINRGGIMNLLCASVRCVFVFVVDDAGSDPPVQD